MTARERALCREMKRAGIGVLVWVALTVGVIVALRVFDPFWRLFR